jgi:arginyl-tRNA synthetase
MRLSDLLTTIIDAALEKITKSDIVSDEDKYDVARKVGIAAIKFGDLINHRSKDYIFDMDKFLSFEGKTGTYLLYTVTRINSILSKVNSSNDAAVNLTGMYTDIERELLLAVIQTGDAFRHAIEEKAPNYICDNAYKLASLFSNFYHDNHIANETDEVKKASWISLCLLTRKLLMLHLDVLGIEAVEKM